jgi:ribosomal protein S18 acetylase RimI-like enzyme
MGDYWTLVTLYPEYCLGARAGETLVGMILALPHTDEREQSQVYIQDVAVDPDHRGEGVATSLLAALAASARERGVGRIWLTTDVTNDGAIALWRKLDFTNAPAGRRQDEHWVVPDLKGKGEDRALFETTPPRLHRALPRVVLAA